MFYAVCYDASERERTSDRTSAKGHSKGPIGPAEHLYLYEKTSVEDHAWTIVEHGSWGKMTILFNKLFFVFNGHKLVNDTDYTLISYKEPRHYLASSRLCYPWNWHSRCRRKRPHNGIDATISVQLYTDPDEAPASDEYSGIGAKIWLVLSSDMVGTTLQNWNASAYLFEGRLLT